MTPTQNNWWLATECEVCRGWLRIRRGELSRLTTMRMAVTCRDCGAVLMYPTGTLLTPMQFEEPLKPSMRIKIIQTPTMPYI